MLNPIALLTQSFKHDALLSPALPGRHGAWVQDRAVAAYLGLAIGDALGATVEFLTPREIVQKHGVHRDITGGGWLRLKAGHVTDDTTMALALGRAILAEQGQVRPLAVAQALDAWMRAKPVDIGNTVRRNLISFRRTGQAEAPESEHDAGNGAAMRILPVALCTWGKTPEAVLAAVRHQGHVTHHNALSDAASLNLVQLLHDLLSGIQQPDKLQERLSAILHAHPVFADRGRRRDNPSGFVVETMQAVWQGFFDTQSFEDCLVDVVNRGGDADTTGAIVGMLAGARYGLDGIPPRWLRALESSVRTQCEQQALALLAYSPGLP